MQGHSTLTRKHSPVHDAPDIDELLSAAADNHEAGRLEVAERQYRHILELQPETPDALNLLGVLMHQRGQHELAESLIKTAIKLNGSEDAYHYNLGEIYRDRGQNERAAENLRKAIELNSTEADYHFSLADALMDASQIVEALDAYRAAVALAPNNPEIHSNLGNALAELGETDAAISHYREALLYDPQYARAHVNLGTVLKERGETELAQASYEKAISLAPEFAQSHYNLAQLLKEKGELSAALDSYKRAAELDTNMSAAFAGMGYVLRELGEFVHAADCYRRVIELEPDDASACTNLGDCLAKLGRDDEAMLLFKHALAIDPDKAEAHFNLGTYHQARGEFEQAIACHREALSLRPDLTEAAYNLASIENAKPDNDHFERLRQQQNEPGLGPDARVNLHFSLARLHDERGEPDAAFAHYRQGNDIKTGAQPFDPVAFTDHIDRIIDTFDADFFTKRDDFGVSSELPVFIVGMPRCGSTLVEQILASHPRVYGAGELSDIRLMVRRLPETLSTATPVPECVAEIDKVLAQRLGGDYLASLREHGKDAERVCDKMLGNFLRLGLITLLTPGARIIHCQRNAMDTCVSCYFQNFARGLRFTYNLEHLGVAYKGYHRLMAHWGETLPLSMMDVEYEELVANQESVSRTLIAFCGLEWDDRCLDFHRQQREVRTASFWQVRQPVYSTSVGRWRKYEKDLAPLIETLGVYAG